MTQRARTPTSSRTTTVTAAPAIRQHGTSCRTWASTTTGRRPVAAARGDAGRAGMT
jgi:hypothetical protein